ncbi:MAG: peptidoglycan DD-metalloendopeptidase family protein [Gammaproteobacteria bacterium]|nr:peptidoglycan DD-metalloendopeptidase family protein [Gammaproteobacteria bacterium]
MCLLCLLPPASADPPADAEEAEARLSEIRQQIQAINRRLAEDRSQRDDLITNLHETELKIARLAKELSELDALIESKRAHLKSLEHNRAARREAVFAQRRELERHIRAAYQIGSQDRLKLLLNQEDAVSVSRAFSYYEYFNRARARRINALRREIEELERIEAGIRAQAEELAAVQAEKSSARLSMEEEHSRRGKLVARLDERIRSAGTQIERLKEDEERLTALVKNLEKELAELALSAEVELKPFPELKGKLPWPVAGNIRHGFGTPREDGNLKWQGVMIAGDRGEPVRAISNGRVAFADWLRGFGFLVILDHGEGYMSLYGHNEALNREAGDWVSAGDVIATLGDSGGRSETALYFEIRHNGVPSNPALWCNRSVPQALVSP